MLLQNVLVGSLLTGCALAKPGVLVDSLFRRGENIEDVLRRDADIMASLTRRQDANNPQTTPASGDASKADLTKWEEQTKAACTNALTSLNGQASNPSGIAVCYNLPFLDNQTGIFEAELRMYNISAPIDPWTGITAGDVNMALSYLGATVQSMNGTFQKRELSWPPIKERGILVERQGANAPSELKVLMYVGKINSNLMGTAMTQATLQPLLIPQIELTAKNPTTGQDVSTTLSSQEASFVNGVFAKQTTSTATSPAAAASASAAVASAAPFIISGRKLAFFPTGLVITCIWTAGFIGAVGLGTFGRIQFRDQYRRRVKNEAVRTQRTI